jgi:hypothetical protein
MRTRQMTVWRTLRASEFFSPSEFVPWATIATPAVFGNRRIATELPKFRAPRRRFD